jgi:hypothetical protein
LENLNVTSQKIILKKQEKTKNLANSNKIEAKINSPFKNKI